MNRRIVSVAVCGLALLLLAGCSGTSGRQSLEGNVTLDGEPLPEGGISFRPLPGTRGPTAGGKISEGKFSVSPGKGTFVGTFRVEITASRKTGRKKLDPIMGDEVDEMVQFIPERYNRQSELRAEVTAEGPNRFDFTLSSQGNP